MDMNTLWFILIGVIFCAFFFLEGFDYGVAILMPFLARKDAEKRIIRNTIGPVWDGNEVWMIVAAGAIFAAFPNWYATLFSSFYIFMFIILLALIVRNVSFEFRDKLDSPAWKNVWDGAFFVGSLIPAFLWGMIFAGLLAGIPINEKADYAGSFLDLIKPVTIAGGFMGLLLFTFHGAVFLLLKTEDDLLEKVKKLSAKVGISAAAGGVILMAWLALQGHAFEKFFTGAASILALLALMAVNLLLFYKKYGTAMYISGLSVVMSVAAIFSGLFPNVMISSLDPAFSLDIYNSASSAYSLKVISICALTLLPIIIAYQAWTYRVFSQRVNSKNLEY